MKKLLIAILFAGFFAVSCNLDPVTLDDLTWTVVSYEDYFNGSVVFSEDLEGTIDSEVYSGEPYFYLTIPAFSMSDEEYEPVDYRIVKYTSDELVIDFWYYEYDDYKESDCEYIETFKGKKIYYAYYNPDNKNLFDIVYFTGPGRSVDCGYETPEGKDPYYFDTTRIYCKR